MRIAPLLLIVTATSLLAWSTWPTRIFIGRVLSAEKVSDVGKDKIAHFEIWKAEVKVATVETGSSLDTNLADRVSVYYYQDWSTNFATIYGAEVGRPPRLRVITNQVYKFFCIRSDIGDKTNVLSAMDGGVKPQ